LLWSPSGIDHYQRSSIAGHSRLLLLANKRLARQFLFVPFWDKRIPTETESGARRGECTMKRSRVLTCISACLLGLLWIPVPLSAQAVYGSIIGTVTDSTGAVVPKAKITVTNTRKGTSDSLTSNPDGNYSVQHLIPDVYTMKVEAPSFATAEVQDIRVSADSAARVDIQLKPQSASQEVVVTTEAPLLKTDRADVATIFDQKQITELPILNRNFTQFLLQTPGTQRLVSFAHAATENPQASQ